MSQQVACSWLHDEARAVKLQESGGIHGDAGVIGAVERKVNGSDKVHAPFVPALQFWAAPPAVNRLDDWTAGT